MDPSYNNPFNNSGASQVPMNDGVPTSEISGGGDIVLQSEKGGKKKKGVIFGAVAFLVVALLVIAVVVFAVAKNGTEATPSSLREKFNNFANYVLYRVESNEDVEDNKNIEYYLSNSLTQEEILEYITKVIEKFIAFRDTYEKQPKEYDSESNEELNEIPVESLNRYYSELNFLEKTTKYPIMDNNDILDLYLENLFDVGAKVAEYYASFDNDEKTISYAEWVKPKIMEVVSAYQLLLEKGCLDTEEKTVTGTCAGFETEPEIVDAYTKTIKYAEIRATEAMMRNVAVTIINEYIWSFRGAIYE